MDESSPSPLKSILQDRSLSPTQKLQALLESGLCPDEILHSFACDCAERVLRLEQQRGRKPQQASWDAIAIKRRWLRGLATEEERLAAVREARRTAHQASVTQRCYEASTAAADAASEVSYVARSAAWARASVARSAPQEDEESICNIEAEWQVSHLLTLLPISSKLHDLHEK